MAAEVGPKEKLANFAKFQHGVSQKGDNLL
jgi:hypothetical protein